MHFVFFAPSPHGNAINDPEYCETNPVGGSETSASRLMACLRRDGHHVELVVDHEPLPTLHCDVFIVLRQWKFFEFDLRPGQLNILWCQDDSDQPFFDPLRDATYAAKIYDACDAVIMLSHYQLRQWQRDLHLPLAKVFMSSNGVSIWKFTPNVQTLAKRSPRAYYASAPARGLESLLKAWPLIHQAIPQAELHVFSSMLMYLEKKRESEFTDLYEMAQNMPGVIYRGSVGQAELRAAAQECRLLAYPCTFPETSCVAAMEALASGCAVVGTDCGALPETAWLNPMIPFGHDWLTTWAQEACRVLLDDDYYLFLAKQNLETARFLSWELVAQRWCRHFSHLLAQRQSVNA